MTFSVHPSRSQERDFEKEKEKRHTADVFQLLSIERQILSVSCSFNSFYVFNRWLLINCFRDSSGVHSSLSFLLFFSLFRFPPLLSSPTLLQSSADIVGENSPLFTNTVPREIILKQPLDSFFGIWFASKRWDNTIKRAPQVIAHDFSMTVF